MKLVLVFAVILGCVSAASLGRRREHYRGNQLLRITAENEEDVKWLKTLEGTSSGTLDFWSKSAGGRTVDVMVSEGYVREFNQMLDRRDLSYRVLMTDVQEHVDEEYEHAMRTSMASRSKRDVSFDYTVYHQYDEIQQWTDDIAAEYEFVTKFSFGTTYEGRDIGALEIAAPPISGAKEPKPVVYFEGGIHAREWISPATVMYFTGKLLENYANGNTDARRVLGMFDLHIIPSLNGDGYVFSWTDERLWRKSRQPNPDFGCMGTDLNRNFESYWGGDGASPWPCSIVFRGFTPMNNMELAAIDNHFTQLKKDNRETKVFIDWHSYSQLILAPWSFDSEYELPEDSEMQLAAASAMAAAMNSTNNVPGGYIHGPSARLLYEAAGASNDYGYAGLPQARYTYVVELRDKGDKGFILPADQIEPTGEESYNGVIALLSWIIDNDY